MEYYDFSPAINNKHSYACYGVGDEIVVHGLETVPSQEAPYINELSYDVIGSDEDTDEDLFKFNIDLLQKSKIDRLLDFDSSKDEISLISERVLDPTASTKSFTKGTRKAKKKALMSILLPDNFFGEDKSIINVNDFNGSQSTPIAESSSDLTSSSARWLTGKRDRMNVEYQINKGHGTLTDLGDYQPKDVEIIDRLSDGKEKKTNSTSEEFFEDQNNDQQDQNDSQSELQKFSLSNRTHEVHEEKAGLKGLGHSSTSSQNSISCSSPYQGYKSQRNLKLDNSNISVFHEISKDLESEIESACCVDTDDSKASMKENTHFEETERYDDVKSKRPVSQFPDDSDIETPDVYKKFQKGILEVEVQEKPKITTASDKFDLSSTTTSSQLEKAANQDIVREAKSTRKEPSIEKRSSLGKSITTNVKNRTGLSKRVNVSHLHPYLKKQKR